MRSGHPDLISMMHDLYYGAKRKPFWVMEQQPGQVNWAPTNPLPAAGMVRLWSHQAFAHGADVVAYFRWRAAQGAQELMHAGLNLHDNTPDRAFGEAERVARELEEAGEVEASEVRAGCRATVRLREPLGHAFAASRAGLELLGAGVELLHGAAAGLG